MPNKMIEELPNGQSRETDFNAPAHETEGARFDMLGQFRQDNVAASQTTTKATLGAVDAAAPNFVLAPRAGTIVGIQSSLVGTITAGTMTLTVMKGATATACTLGWAAADGASPSKQVDLATPIEFAKGDKLSVQVASSAALDPATIELFAAILVRWAP